MNTFKLFPRRTLKIAFQAVLVFLSIALTEPDPSFAGPIVAAAPPIEEMRTIIVQRGLWSPSVKSLAVLGPKNLNVALKHIDPYARYTPPGFLSSARSRSSYLGIEVFSYKSTLWVRADAGGPADLAGVPEIGKLVAINRTPASSLNLAKVSDMLDTAARQSQVTVTISGRQGKKAEAYKVIPTGLRIPSLMWKRVGHRITIRIREFVGHDTAPRLAALFKTVLKAKTEIIIDLRGCTGGDLYEAIEIAGMFVAADLPLATTHDRAGVVQAYHAQSGQKLPRPICLLMDYRTASAAEVLAAILKYYGLTRLVGERSVGKCVSQTTIPLSDGGDLTLTTLEIRFPDGMTCTGKGLVPDIPYADITVARLANIVTKVVNK